MSSIESTLSMSIFGPSKRGTKQVLGAGGTMMTFNSSELSAYTQLAPQLDTVKVTITSGQPISGCAHKCPNLPVEKISWRYE